MDIGRIIWEGVTIAVVVFGALAAFTLRRRFSKTESPPATFWLRYSFLLFGFCLLAAIEAVVLPQYSMFAFWVALGLTALAVAIAVPKLFRG